MADDPTIQVAIAGAAASLGAAIMAGATKIYDALRPSPSDTKIAELERRLTGVETHIRDFETHIRDVDNKLDTVRENLGYVRGALAQLLAAIREGSDESRAPTASTPYPETSGGTRSA